jgi:hypothetical protein
LARQAKSRARRAEEGAKAPMVRGSLNMRKKNDDIG